MEKKKTGQFLVSSWELTNYASLLELEKANTVAVSL